MKRFAATLIPLLFCTPGHAAGFEPIRELVACANIKADAERLRCFDEFMWKLSGRELPMDKSGDGDADVGELEPDPKATSDDTVAPKSEATDWRLTTSKNPIDDTPTVALQAMGQSTGKEFVFFVGRCKSNTTEAYVDFNDYLGDDVSSPYRSGKRVTYRIGQEEAKTSTWHLSTDSTTVFYPGWGGELLKRMLAAEQIVVQVTPYNANPVTAIFETAGLREPLKKLAETCNWKLD